MGAHISAKEYGYRSRKVNRGKRRNGYGCDGQTPVQRRQTVQQGGGYADLRGLARFNPRGETAEYGRVYSEKLLLD